MSAKDTFFGGPVRFTFWTGMAAAAIGGGALVGVWYGFLGGTTGTVVGNFPELLSSFTENLEAEGGFGGGGSFGGTAEQPTEQPTP